MEARRVRQAMDSLTEVQREALELAYLQGLHAHGGRHHARPPRGHGQDTNPGRTDPSPRHDGGGTVTELTARTVRCLRRRRTRRRRTSSLRAAPRTVPRLPARGGQPARGDRPDGRRRRDDPSPGPARLRARGHQERPPASRPRPTARRDADARPEDDADLAPVLPMRPRRRRIAGLVAAAAAILAVAGGVVLQPWQDDTRRRPDERQPTGCSPPRTPSTSRSTLRRRLQGHRVPLPQAGTSGAGHRRHGRAPAWARPSSSGCRTTRGPWSRRA